MSDLLKITVNFFHVLLISHVLPFLYLSRLLKAVEDLTFVPLNLFSYYTQCYVLIVKVLFLKVLLIPSHSPACHYVPYRLPSILMKASDWKKKGVGGID